jgi:hypothetical protein
MQDRGRASAGATSSSVSSATIPTALPFLALEQEAGGKLTDVVRPQRLSAVDCNATLPWLKEQNLCCFGFCNEKTWNGNGLGRATEVKSQFIIRFVHGIGFS